MDIAALRLIIELAVAIQNAADNAQQNRKDCEDIKNRVMRVMKNLWRLENNEQLLKDSAVSPTVAELGKILREAQGLVEKCQVKRNIICVLWTAGKLSKKLKRVDKSITATIIDLMCAMMGRQESRSTKNGDHPPVHDHELVRVLPSSTPDGEMNSTPTSSTLHEIVDIAGQIKETMKMVRQNKEECFEIDNRVGKLSAFLPWLEKNTDMMKDPAIAADLEKLVKTFHHAHELVTACQGRNLLLPCQGVNALTHEELSKQLHEVLDQMVLDLDDMTSTEISIRYATGIRASSDDAVIIAIRFIAKLRLRQKSKRIVTLQSAGQTSSQLDARFKVNDFPEEIEEVATESNDPSLLQGGNTTEAPGHQLPLKSK